MSKQNLKKLASISHAMVNKYFGGDAMMHNAVTNTLLVAVGRLDNLPAFDAKAMGLLAKIGITNKWEHNAPMGLMMVAANKMATTPSNKLVANKPAAPAPIDFGTQPVVRSNKKMTQAEARALGQQTMTPKKAEALAKGRAKLAAKRAAARANKAANQPVVASTNQTAPKTMTVTFVEVDGKWMPITTR